MDGSTHRIAGDVARLYASDSLLELNCDELAGRVVCESGPSRFYCPPTYMKRVLDVLVRGKHLAVRRTRRNLYRLHPDAKTRPPIPAPWFYGIHHGTHSSWQVIVTDRWNRAPVQLLFSPLPTPEVWAYSGTLQGYATADHAFVEGRPGWRVDRNTMIAPWAEAEKLADWLARRPL